MSLETNIYRIENLAELAASYHQYRIKGLERSQQGYYSNVQTLVNRLSRQLQSPVTAQHDGVEAFLIVPADSPLPQSMHQLVGRTVYLEQIPDLVTLDFGRLDEKSAPIALRFLQFSIQGSLWHKHGLWQPGSGKPFFEKRAQSVARDVGLHTGFQVRALQMEDGGIGLCVDAKHAYVSAVPLPSRMSQQDFQRYKMHNMVYHFGHRWYEIRLVEWNVNDVMRELIPDGGRNLPLYEYLHEKCEKPLPKELVNLSKDCAVVAYFNARDQRCTVPTALCYPVLDTGHRAAGRAHGQTIIPPRERRATIQRMVTEYLSKLSHGNKRLVIAARPETIAKRFFPVPDLRFGNNVVLSIKGSAGAKRIDLRDLGSARLNTLRDKQAGFFCNDALGRQYFFMPRSISESWGHELLGLLRRTTDDLYPQEIPYAPELVIYDDRKGSTWVDYGLAIKRAAQAADAKRGYAVVMLHDPSDRGVRAEDELAAYVTQTLYEACDLRTAVIHTETGNECFVETNAPNGKTAYVVNSARRGKLDGYLRGVAINKILLTNEKWPFVLAEPLHADLVIGIDLKKRHVVFTVVGRGGAYIVPHPGRCRFAEQIQTDEFQKFLSTAVRAYFSETGQYAEKIVIHRDGRLFESELQGAKAALATLRDEGAVTPAAEMTFVEISKHSFTSFRIFDALFDRARQRLEIRNPVVGQYYLSNAQDGYICSTGFPFGRSGTVNPLHVRKVEGSMPLEHCLEDVYRLTCLAWTRPEDCTRYPIHIKLSDRWLFEDASEFDEQEITLEEEEVES